VDYTDSLAEEQAGGRTISCARRDSCDSGGFVSFCSDLVNDGRMYLAHGPYDYEFGRVASLPADLSGFTWDGGLMGAMPTAGG